MRKLKRFLARNGQSNGCIAYFGALPEEEQHQLYNALTRLDRKGGNVWAFFQPPENQFMSELDWELASEIPQDLRYYFEIFD